MPDRWPWAGGVAFGADYNPDQWPEDTWPEDIGLMAEVGVNLVTLPVFGWARLEPAEGVFDFAWLDRVLDLLWSRHIRVDLATATASPPAWLVRRHPEILPVTASGIRLEFGSRQTYCPSSPVFRDRTVALCTAMAERYGSHPALAMWHVSNEYGDELSGCWCEESARHFRRWLQRRYTTLEHLNIAWGTDCWGQLYTDWDQVAPPRASTGPVNPAQRLDFERFSSDALIELFSAERAVLRRITPHIPVTTNFMGLFRGVDYGRLATVEDVVSDDAYPDPADPEAHVRTALDFSLMRSLKPEQPWLLLEQAPSAVSWREVNLPKSPGQMRLTSLQALAHGANGIMFFQWRASRSGPERFHSAMLGHRGTGSRTWAECRQLGEELGLLAEVTNSHVRAQAAVIVDWDSWRALDVPDSLPSQRLRWEHQVRSFHSALYALGVTADVVPIGSRLEHYRVLLAPNLFVIDEAQACQLQRYVHAGGQLLIGPFSGVVDPTNAVHEGGAPGPLRQLLGVEVDEPWPLPDGLSLTVQMEDKAAQASLWSEVLVPTQATAVATYRDGPLVGQPAVTRNGFGEGAAWYLSTCLKPSSLQALVRCVCESAKLPLAAEPNSTVEMVTRISSAASYTFVLNHSDRTVSTLVPVTGVDLLSGRIVNDSVTLAARQVIVIRSADRLGERRSNAASG